VGELKVSLVAADRMVWEGTASMVVAKTTEGEIGILPGHEPVLALLVNGAVRIQTTDGDKLVAAVHEGFFSVDQDVVSLLAETAELATEIDLERAERAKQRALDAGADDPDEIAALERAETRIQVASIAKGIRSH
jgi:F-type H+-transporting ATPase subunit epsilon